MLLNIILPFIPVPASVYTNFNSILLFFNFSYSSSVKGSTNFIMFELKSAKLISLTIVWTFSVSNSVFVANVESASVFVYTLSGEKLLNFVSISPLL